MVVGKSVTRPSVFVLTALHYMLPLLSDHLIPFSACGVRVCVSFNFNEANMGCHEWMFVQSLAIQASSSKTFPQG